MTDQTPRNTESALTITQKTLKKALETPTLLSAFRRVLKENTEIFTTAVLALVAEDKMLKVATPASILNAAMLSATMDLSVAKQVGHAYIVPFRARDGKVYATFIMGYRGYIQLALRTGEYETIHAGKVYEGQLIETDPLRGIVKITGQPTSKKVIAYTGYFKLKSGYEKAIIMTTEEIIEHAEKYSKSWGKPDSAWTTAFDEMALKTMLRRLISKYGMMSVKMQRAIQAEDRDTAEDENIEQAIGSFTDEFIDAVVTEMPQDGQQAEQPQAVPARKKTEWESLYELTQDTRQYNHRDVVTLLALEAEIDPSSALEVLIEAHKAKRLGDVVTPQQIRDLAAHVNA